MPGCGWRWTDGPTDKTIFRKKDKPTGCSDARWKMELQRRAQLKEKRKMALLQESFWTLRKRQRNDYGKRKEK